MFQTLRKAWGVPEIRKKILYTLLMIILFRFGCAVAVPFLNNDVVKAWMDTNATDGGFLDYLNVMKIYKGAESSYGKLYDGLLIAAAAANELAPA